MSNEQVREMIEDQQRNYEEAMKRIAELEKRLDSKYYDIGDLRKHIHKQLSELQETYKTLLNNYRNVASRYLEEVKDLKSEKYSLGNWIELEKIKLVLKEFLEIQLKHLTLPIDEDELKKILERLIEQLEGSELSGNIREGDLAVGEPQRVVRHLRAILKEAKEMIKQMENIANWKEILKILPKQIELTKLIEFPTEQQIPETENTTILGFLMYLAQNYKKIDKIHIFEKSE